MVTFFCPNCWAEVKEEDKVCPHCAVVMQDVRDQRSYVDSLIAALAHPEPTTPIRAAWILGLLRAKAAVEPLINLLSGKADPYQKAAAVEALGHIGDESARDVLAELADQGPFILRAKAREALERLSTVTPELRENVAPRNEVPPREQR
jgi:HEAT repeat protein